MISTTARQTINHSTYFFSRVFCSIIDGFPKTDRRIFRIETNLGLKNKHTNKCESKHHGKISDNLPKIDKSNGDSVIDYFLLKFDSNI
jgi:hypothetical protein